MRYFFHIGYKGESYNGWQKNGKVNSIQKAVEDKLFQILKTKIFINGCGRTDAKVNASQFFFHADFNENLDQTLLFRLNRSLPDDIAIFDIIEMDGLPHARFDAFERTYDYFIHTKKDPFLSKHSSLYLNFAPDYIALKKATDLLPKYQDYRPFCTSPDKNEHTICNVKEAKWLISDQEDQLRFQITSNRFLSKMIRILIGQLIKVAKGELSVDAFEEYFITKETPRILSPAHPQGLYLSKVTYPYLDLSPETSFLGLNNAVANWKVI